jgi:ribose transport system permease protein
MPSISKKISLKNINLVYPILVMLLIASEIISPGFLGFKHMESVLRSAAFLGIAAIGQTLVIMLGGIDLSIGAVISMANLMSAQILNGSDANIGTALLYVLAMGLLCGIMNGVGVYYFKIPSLVMTLGMSVILVGVALLYSNGAPKGATAPLVKFMSTGRIGDVFPVLIVIWIVLAAIAIIALRYTVFGRNIYVLGTNPTVARYSGLKLSALTISIYTISAVMAAITGFLLVGYTGTSFMNIGEPYTLNTIAAVVVGGTLITGGRGSYLGTVMGSIIMTIVYGLVTIIHLPESGRLMILGLIIIILVFIYGREKEGRQ